MNRINYFAYGSNMLTDRMQYRTPSAIQIGIGLLKDYDFVCNKKSIDGSGKGNLVLSENSEVWGVIFEIYENDLSRLDEIEGGYQRKNVTVLLNNTPVTAVTYISDKLTGEPPTQSYLQLIIDGAIEHQLPEDYIAKLKAIDTKN